VIQRHHAYNSTYALIISDFLLGLNRSDKRYTGVPNDLCFTSWYWWSAAM